MAFASPGDGSLDYFPCRYGGARLTFRGPVRGLTGDHVVVLGGTETYGKFIPEPYPDLLERRLGRPVVNLGCVNAGPDVYLAEPEVLALASEARAAIVQVTGAANLSNRFYAVHPRRNDRFLRGTAELRALYPELDLADVHFTRHLLAVLRDAAPRRFEQVAAELRQVWVARMAQLLSQLRCPVILLWMSRRHPPEPGKGSAWDDPVLVDSAMLAALRPRVAAVVDVTFTADAARAGLQGKAYAPLDRPAAEGVPGPLAHAEVAEALAAALPRLV
jgi:hypothetical protein